MDYEILKFHRIFEILPNSNNLRSSHPRRNFEITNGDKFYLRRLACSQNYTFALFESSNLHQNLIVKFQRV
ncbi:hypothetical protein CAMGR0001_1264 [Campylobacter gracilis RM3268]|uniref:Uncharacterized protein n=1 Tax=Campylobacter gracilis RM3268 TaxID=553220 RepID=C8PJ65_9BACT|nr:hypothetical protein CAMGR0001_1264 [Campylobacter gracilis RM3268]